MSQLHMPSFYFLSPFFLFRNNDGLEEKQNKISFETFQEDISYQFFDAIHKLIIE